MSDWRQQVSSRLAERDEIESKYEALIQSYSKTVQRALQAEEENEKSKSPEERSKLLQLEQQLADKNEALYSITQKYDALVKESRDDKSYIKQLETQLAQVQTSLSDYRSESSKKSNELQNLQDEFLVLQLSLHVAESKTKKLEDENANLVDRWMKKAADEANQMNEANEFLQSLEKYR